MIATAASVAKKAARRWGSALLERERRQPLEARPVEVLEFAETAGDGSVGDLVPRSSVVWFRRRLAAAPRPGPVRRAAGEGRSDGAHGPGGKLDLGRPQPDAAAGRADLRGADGGGAGGEADGAGEDSGWQLASDHPACKPVAFPEEAVILGRVVWTARALV